MTTSEGRHAPRDEDAPAGDPEEAGRLARYLGRPLLLVFWTLIVWGTVYCVLFAIAVLTDGPSRALERAVTGPDWIFGVANLALAAVAVLVWIAVGLTVVRVRSAPDNPDRE